MFPGITTERDYRRPYETNSTVYAQEAVPAKCRIERTYRTPNIRIGFDEAVV